MSLIGVYIYIYHLKVYVYAVSEKGDGMTID